MTKVLFARSILEYRRGMAETVCQIVKENFIAGVKTYRSEEPPLADADLLPPPRIEAIDLTFYEGKVDDHVMMVISDDFGITSVQVIIQDDKGNFIEGGTADQFPDGPDCWSYVATVPVTSGTSVIVHAAATDCLGGVGVCRMGTTLPA